MGDLRKRLVELAASVARGNYDPTEPPPGRWSRVQKWRDHDAVVDRLKRLGLAIKDIADGEAKAATDALRSIATIIGCPANTDPLTDLPGLVMMVQAVVQRAESRDIRLAAAEGQAAAAVAEVRALRETLADAVAAERMAIGAWVRANAPGSRTIRDHIARSIEHGDHIDDDAPPLPSLRDTLLLRNELNRQIKAMEEEREAHILGRSELRAERDRRIDPVEHARAVMKVAHNGMPADSLRMRQAWLDSVVRATLLARVGPDVLAEVER